MAGPPIPMSLRWASDSWIDDGSDPTADDILKKFNVLGADRSIQMATLRAARDLLFPVELDVLKEAGYDLG